jgi:peroxiredoxin Q/BCP
MALEIGKPLPDFSLESTDGKRISLKDLRGKKVVLYFYPEDDTPTCTKQACGFREVFAEFKKAGAVVLGISPDDVASHEKFRAKFKLPFTLLADPGHVVAEKYGVWGEKLNYGRKYMGIRRTTILVDAQGNVARVFERVRTAGHAERMLEALKEI